MGTLLNCLTDCTAYCCKLIAVPYDTSSRMEYVFHRVRGAVGFSEGYAFYPVRCPKLGPDNRCLTQDNKPLACVLFKPGSPLCLACRKIQGV